MSALVTGIAAATRAAWRRWAGALRAGAPPPALPPRLAYDLWAPTYGSPPTRLQELEARARERVLESVRGARVLDLGCGTGRIARDALERGAAAAVGMDASLPMLARAALEPAENGAAWPAAGTGVVPPATEAGAGPAAARTRLAWAAAEAARLPFRAGCFDAVICALVLGHVRALESVLGEVARVTRPGGWIVISEFHPSATLRGWERTFEDRRSGRTYRVEQHLHMLEDYFRVLDGLGFAIEDVAESRYEGTPVVFALRATKGAARRP